MSAKNLKETKLLSTKTGKEQLPDEETVPGELESVSVATLVPPQYIDIVIYIVTQRYIVIWYKDKTLSILYLVIRNTEILPELGCWSSIHDEVEKWANWCVYMKYL